jgi:methylamine utilization protein MauE
MVEFVTGVATYVVVFLLTAACVGHARRPDDLPSALREHGVVPAATAGAVGLAVTVTEGVLVALLLAGLFGSQGLLAAGLSGSAVVFAGYGGYGWLVVASGRPGRCGCATPAARRTRPTTTARRAADRAPFSPTRARPAASTSVSTAMTASTGRCGRTSASPALTTAGCGGTTPPAGPAHVTSSGAVTTATSAPAADG